MTVSIDGTKRYHDSHRKRRGQGTFDEIMRNVETLGNSGIHILNSLIVVRDVTTTLDPEEVVSSLLGKEIGGIGILPELSEVSNLVDKMKWCLMLMESARNVGLDTTWKPGIILNRIRDYIQGSTVPLEYFTSKCGANNIFAPNLNLDGSIKRCVYSGEIGVPCDEYIYKSERLTFWQLFLETNTQGCNNCPIKRFCAGPCGQAKSRKDANCILTRLLVHASLSDRRAKTS